MIKTFKIKGFWNIFKSKKVFNDINEKPIKYDNSHLPQNTGIYCTRTKKEIYVGDTILFEDWLYAGTRVVTCEAIVRLDDEHIGYYLDGFFMESGDKIPFKYKLSEELFSNFRLV